MADIFDVLSDPTRRGILVLLRDRLAAAEPETSVAEIVDALSIARQSANRHLGILNDAGLVVANDDGPRRTYSLDAEPLGDAEDWLGQFAGLEVERGAVTASGTAFVAWAGADVGETIGRVVARPAVAARSALRKVRRETRERRLDTE